MQSGTSLYLAIIVMIILLAIVLGLTSILLGQMVMVRKMGYSVIALSAADAGIEAILVDQDSPATSSVILANRASYETSLLLGALKGVAEGSCSSTIVDWNYCITSVGIYEGVRRAIEIAY